MDTLLILRDTITANVVKVTNSCSHCVQETGTNWADVQIVFIICLAIVLSILIIAITVGVLVWHYNDKTKECFVLKEKYNKSEHIDEKSEKALS